MKYYSLAQAISNLENGTIPTLDSIMEDHYYEESIQIMENYSKQGII